MKYPFNIKDNTLMYEIYNYITKNATATEEDYDDKIEYHIAKEIAKQVNVNRFDNTIITHRVNKLLN